MQIQGEENLKRVEVGGELVAVLEKRAVDAKREGYFIVQVRVCGCVEGVWVCKRGVDAKREGYFIVQVWRV